MPRRSLTRLCRIFPILKMQCHPNTRIGRNHVIRRATFLFDNIIVYMDSIFFLLSARYANNEDKDPEDMADHK
jgi:hypothetical protein